jgi:hypothetical protein
MGIKLVGPFTNRANQDSSAATNPWQNGNHSSYAFTTASFTQETPNHNQAMGQLSQPDVTDFSLDSSSQLAYNSYASGGPMNPYQKVGPESNNDYSLNMFRTRRESTPLSEEDFVVRRPHESLDSSNARKMFESATAHGRASHRESLEDSESNSDYNSDEELDEEPDGERQDDSGSSSQEESIRNDE